MLNQKIKAIKTSKWNRQVTCAIQAALLSSSLLVISCKTRKNTTQVLDTESNPAQQSSGQTCAAIRGNGPRIFAHFGALAKLVEDENTPLISSIAGGSSVTITAFLYESMLLNELIANEPDQTEKRRKLALMLKTLDSLPTLAANSPPAQALFQFQLAAKTLQKDENNIPPTEKNPSSSQAANLRASLLTLLSTQNRNAGSEIINPELLRFARAPEPSLQTFRNNEVRKTLSEFGNFSAKDPRIMLRPGLFDFNVFSKWIGFLGGFYEGKTDQNAFWKSLFDNCKLPKGESWPAAANNDATCRVPFENEFRKYIASPNKLDRSQDPLGKGLNTIIGVAFTSDKASISQFNARKSEYESGTLKTDTKSILTNFSKVSFGYYGATSSLSKVTQEKAANPNDAYWQKVETLESSSWHEVLMHSPAEPGLDSAHLVTSSGDTKLFFGGWSALFPVDIIKSQGCQSIIFVTRPVDKQLTTEFARDVAGLLGMTPEEDKVLFDPNNTKSAFNINVSHADKIMCPDWDNKPKATASIADFHQLFETGFRDSPIGAPGPSSALPFGCK